MQTRDDLPDHKLVVGCVRDSQLHIESGAVQLITAGLYDKIITLAEAKFFSAANLGDSWTSLVTKIILYGLDELGNMVFVKDGFLKPRSETSVTEPSVQ